MLLPHSYVHRSHTVAPKPKDTRQLSRARTDFHAVDSLSNSDESMDTNPVRAAPVLAQTEAVGLHQHQHGQHQNLGGVEDLIVTVYYIYIIAGISKFVCGGSNFDPVTPGAPTRIK